jgi:hypothetical protein
MQNYNNFHIVYVDRLEDSGFEQIEELLMEHNQKRVYRQSERKGKRKLELQYHVVVHADEISKNDVENLYMVADTHCKPQEMVVFVDISDYFIGKEVLKLFNAVYEDKKYDLAYTNFLDANNQIGNLTFMPKKKVNRTALATSNIEAPLFAVPLKTVTLIL